MRIDDFLNQSISVNQIKKQAAQSRQVQKFSLPEHHGDKVTISAEAKEAAEKAGGYFTSSNTNDPSSGAKAEFKHYMDAITGKVPGAPKTPEEQMEEIQEKIKKIQTRMAEILADTSMPGETKARNVTALNSQLEALYMQLSKIGEEMTESLTA